MVLGNADLTLGDIDLGSVDAEADHRLPEYFVKTPYVESALRVQRSHYLGRKGSGKSALFTQLPRLIQEATFPDTRVLCLTPDQYAWNALRQYQELGLLPEQAHTNAWKFTIAIEVAGALADLPDHLLPSSEPLEARRLLASFIKANYGETAPTLYSTASRLLKGIKSFNLQAFGFGAGLERAEQEQALTPLVIDSLLEAIATVAAHVGVVVALDKLDDSWDGSDESKHLFIGLLKATKELNDRFSSQDPATGLSVLTFLRSDIYEGLQFDDKDKHRAAEEHIVWDTDLLREMINERLPEGVGPDDLFEEGEMRGSILPFNYIVKRTFLRPREVLQFLQECIHRAGRDARKITKDQVREAEERYSSWKVEDLKQEYRRLHPEFDEVLEGLRQGQHRYDSIGEFEEYLQENIPEVVEKLGVRKVVELLFNSSVVGVRLGDAGSARYRCEDSDLVLPASGAVYVHQSLYRGLNIREKRARE